MVTIYQSLSHSLYCGPQFVVGSTELTVILGKRGLTLCWFKPGTHHEFMVIPLLDHNMFVRLTN